MNNFKFAVINPLLHNELRLKIMVALDSLDSADFVYLCQITEATRGNLSIQIKTLKKAGYLEVSKTGFGRFSHTVCRITRYGRESLHAYEDSLRRLFAESVPPKSEKADTERTSNAG